tara:strand:- start:533 stop:991 length:459 start_codon:yes stop_codon:yes gene_type:complete
MKKLLIFLVNPGLLIPVISIFAVLYFGGFFQWSKTFKEYKVDVCTRSLELTGDTMRGTETNDGIFRWFVVCGHLGKNIYNDNKPGVLINGQEDKSTRIKTKIRCLVGGQPSPGERSKFQEIVDYGEKCIVDKIHKLNNGAEIYNINKGLKSN